MSRRLFAICSRLLESARDSKGSTDAELLSRFVQSRDSAAFELLVWRHGPLVWSVCRRLLGPSADAEDAFQATFIVLARKAGAIANGVAFVGWLHRVAWSTALNVRKSRARQIHRERPLETGYEIPQDDDPSRGIESAEQNEILDRELARLPEKYRLPLILCDLESRSREVAAGELKLPLGTLNSRLARGRDLLRRRLLRCGVAFTGLGALGMVPLNLSAKLPHLLCASSTIIDRLADSTIRSMAVAGLGKALGAVALCGALIAGASMMTLGAANGPKNPPTPAKEPAKDLPAAMEEKQSTASHFIDPDAGPLPEGAVARIGSTRLRHTGEVTGLKYSPDGKWLASVSTYNADRTTTTDATARLWDAATGKQQLLVKIHKVESDLTTMWTGSGCLGFSKDSRQIFVIDETSFRAFDIDTGKELFAHAVPKNEPRFKAKGPFLANANVDGALISPDGKTYVLIQRQSRFPLEIRDVATGNVLTAAERPFQPFTIKPLEFSPDSRHILVEAVRNQCQLAVIEVATGKTVGRFEGSDRLAFLRFVPGTDKLVGLVVGAKPRKGTVTILDWKTGKSVGSIEVDETLSALEVAPDGKTLIAGAGGASNNGFFSQVIDIETGKEIARLPGTRGLRTLAFSPDGKLLAGAHRWLGAITVWDMKTHHYHATAAEPVSFNSVHFGNDSNTLAIPERDCPLIDWRTGKVLERMPESDHVRWWLDTLSPNRQWIAKRQERELKDNSISVVGAKSGKEFRKFKGHTQFVNDLSFSRDESRLASASWDKTIVWSLKSGDEIAQFTAPGVTGFGRIALSDDGRIVAAGCQTDGPGYIILIWDVDAKKQLERLEDQAWLDSGVAVSPDGKWLAAGGGHNEKQPNDETSVQIWETATGRLVHMLPGHNCKDVGACSHSLLTVAGLPPAIGQASCGYGRCSRDKRFVRLPAIIPA